MLLKSDVELMIFKSYLSTPVLSSKLIVKLNKKVKYLTMFLMIFLTNFEIWLSMFQLILVLL